jgi:hypothetical protein
MQTHSLVMDTWVLEGRLCGPHACHPAWQHACFVKSFFVFAKSVSLNSAVWATEQSAWNGSRCCQALEMTVRLQPNSCYCLLTLHARCCHHFLQPKNLTDSWPVQLGMGALQAGAAAPHADVSVSIFFKSSQPVKCGQTKPPTGDATLGRPLEFECINMQLLYFTTAVQEQPYRTRESNRA